VLPVKINGLPAHVLLVHVVIVLVPLAALMLVASAIWPVARAKLDFLTPAVALVALIFVPITTHAGEWLRDHLPGASTSPSIARHADLGDTLLPWALGLFLVAAAVWVLGRRYGLSWTPGADAAVRALEGGVVGQSSRLNGYGRPVDAGVISVVLVDDAAEVRSLVRTQLRVMGRFEIVGEGSTGAEAIVACREHQPDIVLLDVSMPDMDGFEALPAIREASPRTRVVMYTGFEERGLAERARELGADALIEKSAPMSMVVEQLSAIGAKPLSRLAAKCSTSTSSASARCSRKPPSASPQ
jgi:DNA-binding NarL/FixJ family response regulator